MNPFTSPLTPDLQLVPPGHCPACGQKLRTTKRRVCAGCAKPILRHHRFFFDGSTVRHRNCGEPTAFIPMERA